MPPPAPQLPKPKMPMSAIFSIAVLAILLVVALAIGFSFFSKGQDYKNNSDKKVAIAVAAANKTQAAKDQAAFNEQLKKPYKNYSSPSSYGTITFDYPKTWSVYADDTSSSEPVNGYFYPAIVPATGSGQAYALRVELVSQDYASALQQYSSSIKNGSITAAAYTPPKIKNVSNVTPGTRLDGALTTKVKGSMVIIKVRDKTLKIYTESTDFTADFNNIVLPNLTFVP